MRTYNADSTYSYDSDVLSWIIVVGRGFSCSFFSGFQDRFFRRFLS